MTFIESAALIALVGCVGIGADAQAPDDVAAIVSLEERLAAAWVNGDREFIERLLAPEWTVTDASGRVLTKQQVLEETFVSADRKIETMVVDDVKVRVFRDAAVATGRTRAAGRYQGKVTTVVLRFTDVFIRQNGQWQVIVSHGSLVAP